MENQIGEKFGVSIPVNTNVAPVNDEKYKSNDTSNDFERFQTILYLTKQRIHAGFENILFVLAKRFKRFSNDFRTI